MKVLLITILSIVFFTTSAFAQCDFSKDIKNNGNGTYTYTEKCHIEAGKAIQKVPVLDERIGTLEKKIELKDLMIEKRERQAELWMDTSFKLNDKLQTYDKVSSQEKWLSFALGAGLTVLSVWAAGQINK